MVREDVLDGMSNIDILRRYRFDREGIDYLVNVFDGQLHPKTGNRRSLSVKEKLLITLRFLGSGEFMLNDGDLHHVSQGTVSKTIDEVLGAMSSPRMMRRYVKFPSTRADLNSQVQQFGAIANFPKVIGIIDGTQIRCQAPSVEEELFVNRKGHHSINVQLVCNADDELVDVVARWPGSTHDSRILQNSGLRQLFEGGAIPAGFHLLGDSGYPCRTWLLTPYINPQPGAQRQYNRSHKITRSKVERAIGQLKRRFGILNTRIRMKPEKVCRAIVACVILHNICKRRAIPLPNGDDGNDGDGDGNGNAGGHNMPQVGLRYRDYVANTYF